MEYTVVVSEGADARWRAVATALPTYVAEAESKDAVLDKVKEQLAQTQIEVVQVEVQPQKPSGTNGFKFEEEWPEFGKHKGDPVWAAVFDEIEQERARASE